MHAFSIPYVVHFVAVQTAVTTQVCEYTTLKHHLVTDTQVGPECSPDSHPRTSITLVHPHTNTQSQYENTFTHMQVIIAAHKVLPRVFYTAV